MNKNYKSEQSGRSMVEMLGVLAVIGVLSITGISGYTTAMNKHKANEILDAASKRAVAVSTQIQRGNTNPTLAEFDDYKVGGAKFDTQIGTQGTDKFVIKFTEEPSDEVWSQIQSIAGTSGVVRGYTTDTLGLVYNNDLTTDAKASDNNGKGAETCGSGNTYCSGSGLCLEGTNQTCTCSGTRPACKKCDTSTGSYVADTDGTSCTTTNNKAGTCSSGTCVETPACSTSGSCTTNDACCTGYYCKLSVVKDGDECSTGSGTCTAVGSYQTQNGYTYSTSEKMTWDAAKNWCAAVGKKENTTLNLTTKAMEDDLIKGTNDSVYSTLKGDQESFDGGDYWTNVLDGYSTSCSAGGISTHSYGENPTLTDRSDNSYALCESSALAL